MDSTAVVRTPTYHTSLIGRAADVTAITGLLQNPANRLVTLVGASGSGKTRLALEVAANLASGGAERIVFVALAPIQDSRFVLSAIASELEIKEQSQEPLLDTLCRELSGKGLLLILDNLEQVREIATDLGHLARASADLTILATSQVPLAIPEETTYPVPPLALPPDSATLNPAELLQYPSVALFVERLRMVQPRFKLDKANARSVVSICQLLDGYPLAIELVAAHSSALSPADLLLLLRNHLHILPHQKTANFSSRTAILKPVLDWCTSRLPLPAQQLFHQVGVFLGGWTTEAAQSIMAPELGGETVAESLTVLVQKHLVLIETLHGQNQRYVVLDAVRDYSASRLKQRQGALVNERHANYYHALAHQAEAVLLSDQQVFWFQRLDEEIHNLRAAMKWAIANQRPVAALQIAAALFRFWLTRAFYKEGEYWLDLGLKAAADASAADRAKAWKVLGVMAVHQGNFSLAQESYDKAIGLYAQVGDFAGLGATFSNRGLLLQQQGQMDAAIQAYAESLDAHRQAAEPNHGLIANTLNNLGGLCEIQGRYDEAVANHQESLALRRTLGDTGGIAMSLLNLGVVHERQGEYEQARDNYAESLQGFESVGDQQNCAICVGNLGSIALEQGDYPQARAYFTDALGRYSAAGNLYGEAALRENLGNLAFFERQLDAAARDLAAAHELFTAIGAGMGLTYVYFDRSRLAYAQGDRDAAWELLLTAFRRAREASLQGTLIEGAEFAALLLADMGERDEAARLLAAVAQGRAARSLPRSPSLARWYDLYAPAFQSLIAAAPAEADQGAPAASPPAIDSAIESLEARFGQRSAA